MELVLTNVSVKPIRKPSENFDSVNCCFESFKLSDLLKMNWTSEHKSSVSAWWWCSPSVQPVWFSVENSFLHPLFFLCADVSSRAHGGFVVNLDQSFLSNYCTKSCCQEPIKDQLLRMCARLCVFVMRWVCPQQHYCLLFFWNVRPLKHSLPVLACACYRHLCVCMRVSGVYGLSICNAISICSVCLHAAWICMFANLPMAQII